MLRKLASLQRASSAQFLRIADPPYSRRALTDSHICNDEFKSHIDRKVLPNINQL